MVTVAQLVEPRIVIPVVVGSNPISHPNSSSKNHFLSFLNRRRCKLNIYLALRGTGFSALRCSERKSTIALASGFCVALDRHSMYTIVLPDPETGDMLEGMIGQFYGGREWMQRDEAIRSGAFAAQTMMLSAKNMGYDSCPMIGFDQDEVAKLIRLPEDHLIVMMLVVSKATTEPWARGGQLAMDEVVVENQF